MSVQITTEVLGLEPYVLLTLKTDPDDGEMIVKISGGGGIETREDVGTALALALSGMGYADNPLTQDLDALVTERPELAEAVAVIRERFGWPRPGEADASATA